MMAEHDSTTTQGNTMQLPKFVSRVYAYPIVNDACGQVANVYSKVKDCNRVMHAGLDLAESGLKLVSTTATPIITKFDNQITYIDDLTCKQLDKLEEKVPVVTKPTQQVSKEAKVFLNDTITPRVEAVENAYQNVKNKVTSVHEYGKNQLMKAADTSYGKFALSKVDNALEITDKYLDYYLPEDDKAEVKGDKVEKPVDTLGKAGYLTTKMRKRMFAKAMSQIQQVKVRSSEAVEKMNFTVDLISYAKTHLQTVADKATHLEHDFKYKLWELETAEESEMKQMGTECNDDCHEGDESSETGKTKERKLLKSLLHWSHKLNLSLQAGKAVLVENVPIPENIKHAYSAATETAQKLYNELSHLKAKNYLESIPLVKTSFATIDYYLKSVFDYADDAYKHLVARKDEMTRNMKSSVASSKEQSNKSEGDPNKSTSSESFNTTQENIYDAQENNCDSNEVTCNGDEESDENDDDEVQENLE
jgi:hypothetical protein